MTKKSIIWGLETPISAHAILNLQERKLINICAWFGDKRASTHVTHHCYDFQGKTKAIEETTYNRVTNSVYDEVYARAYPIFLEMTSRSYQNDIKSFHDLADIFNTQFNYLEALVNQIEVDFILFHNIPHEGPDYILYEIATAKKIEILILTQSPFAERFFIMRSIEDLGLFKTAKTSHGYKPEKIENKFEKEYFYMPKNLGALRRIQNLLSNYLWLSKIFISWLSLFGLHKTRRYFYRYFYYLDFEKNKSKSANNNIDLSCSFVYFPLHLQPEMTTSALGGIYCDQLLAIERLRDLLPPDWHIYIKENPKQTYTHRGSDFYKRLRRIPNAQYITDADTYTLTKHSQFVATISGSAGWEAICGGKNALIFGHAWYQTLPGVFKYTRDLELNKILEFTIEHSNLQSEFETLMRRSSQGVVDPAYIALLTSFDSKANNNYIEAALLEILQ